jgi:dihydroorotate dehydrogenase (NAD+) catalytic subunit
MPASGTFGFGDVYHDLINIEKLGAIVTNPVTYTPWSPAKGTRVIPLDAGVLVHTGLPNPGLSKIIKQYQHVWAKSPVPIIVHLVATTPEQVAKGVQQLDAVEAVAGVELGLHDDASFEEVEQLMQAAVSHIEKPLLVRIPSYNTHEFAYTVAEHGADAIVIAAPPRGTARDPHSGQLISGRIYAPTIKPMILRLVGQLRQQIPAEIPIIGSGGIHSLEDARDYLEAGAVAVQVDTAIWVQPRILERIARDLSGNLLTRPTQAFPDEWNADMGDTLQQNRKS